MESTHSPQQPAPEAASIWQRYATTWKGLIIFFLMLILLIPAAMVGELINERQYRRDEAVREVSQKWGNDQQLSGPVLVVPFEQINRGTDGKEIARQNRFAYFLPDELSINGQATPEKRYRGIFEVVLYSSQIMVEGKFSRPAVEQMVPSGSVIHWDKALLTVGIPDLRGLNDQVSLRWGGQSSVFDPGIPVPGVAESGIHAPVALSEADKGLDSFRIDISLKGSGSLSFTPLGKVTDVRLSAPWADPSFNGAFLPDEKNISPQGFEASWRVLNLNRNYPQQWLSDQQDEEGSVRFEGSAFGVDFLLPVDNYQKATRSVKYAILFISLTFLTVFFIEMRQTRRVHPFQYLLIGLALVIFYTLLVSISEHLAYNTAYLISAVMTVGLSTLYARSLFDSNQMALLVGGTLTLLYGFLFVVLQQQDYALLIGSLGLFAILATVMYVSRKINWG